VRLEKGEKMELDAENKEKSDGRVGDDRWNSYWVSARTSSCRFCIVGLGLQAELHVLWTHVVIQVLASAMARKSIPSTS